jgi:hypothetical protein
MGSPKEYYQNYNKKYYTKNKQKEITRVLEYQYRLKQIAFAIYSDGKMCCSICGFDDIDCLDIDHINNDGWTHRKNDKNFSKSLYLYLQKQGYPETYQVLCKNCNWKKYLEYKTRKEEKKWQ